MVEEHRKNTRDARENFLSVFSPVTPLSFRFSLFSFFFYTFLATLKENNRLRRSLLSRSSRNFFSTKKPNTRTRTRARAHIHTHASYTCTHNQAIPWEENGYFNFFFRRLHGSHTARPMERERRFISLIYIVPETGRIWFE